jgi:hypothetical protein
MHFEIISKKTCTIIGQDRLSKTNEMHFEIISKKTCTGYRSKRLSVKIDLYLENDLSTSQEVKGAYLLGYQIGRKIKIGYIYTRVARLRLTEVNRPILKTETDNFGKTETGPKTDRLSVIKMHRIKRPVPAKKHNFFPLSGQKKHKFFTYRDKNFH